MIYIFYYLMVIFCLFFFFVGKQKVNHGFSLISVFNVAWLIAYSVYASGIYPYYDLDIRVIIYSAIYISCVNIGFFILKRGDGVDDTDTKVVAIHINKSSRRISFLYVLSIVFWILLRNKIIAGSNIISSSGMITLRMIAYLGDMYSTTEKLAYDYFVQPVFILTILVTVQTVVLNKFSWKSVVKLLIAIIDALVYSLIFGGRALLAAFLMYFGFMLLINSGAKILQLIYKKRMTVLLLFTILIPVLRFATLRMSRDWGIFKEIGVYFTGGLGYLSYMLKNSTIDMGVLFGRGMIGCLYDALALALRFLGFDTKLVSQYYSFYTNPQVHIGEGISTNFTATSMAIHLLDFGVIGLFLGGILFGLLIAYFENKIKSTPSLYNLTVYLYISVVCFETIQNYTLKSVIVLFIFIYSYLIIQDNKRIKLVIKRK